jgi:hypothetical protein
MGADMDMDTDMAISMDSKINTVTDKDTNINTDGYGPGDRHGVSDLDIGISRRYVLL